MFNLTAKQEASILKVAKGKQSISAKDYRNAINSKKKKSPSRSITSGGLRQNAILKPQQKRREFSFVFTIEEIAKNKEYLFALKGKHLSTNSVNSLSFKDKLRYKTSIKNSILEAALIYRKLIPKKAFQKVVITPTTFQSRSRDDDNLHATSKIIRDSIVNIGFVVDDKRENLKQEATEEVISKDWKIEISLHVL